MKSWIITEGASWFANLSSIMIQKISPMLEVVFLAAEDSIQVLEPPRVAYL